jgi:hypothetical protein
MVLRKPFRSQPAAIERRSGRDRRQVDKGPPSGRDRRVGLEPRRPEVVELEVSVSEWLALQEAPTAAAPGRVKEVAEGVAEGVAAGGAEGVGAQVTAEFTAEFTAEVTAGRADSGPGQAADPARAARAGRVR